MLQGTTLLIITYFIVLLVIIIITLIFVNKHFEKKLERRISEFDKMKNEIASLPVSSELSKVETIIKNERMEEMYKDWMRRYENIKNGKLVKINDMIIDLDLYVQNRDTKNLKVKIAKTEMEIYKAKVSANRLLKEVQEVTISEEKYRGLIIKLKTKYRRLNKEFNDHKNDYLDASSSITLQFENIEKRFSDFEVAMEANDYSEVVHIVKALDTMIDHMDVIVKEVPDLVLIANELIPHRIDEINKIYDEMINDGYQLDYLNIPYNVSESSKNVSLILDRIKVLNLEDCMFELKTMLDYLDSLFNDFDNEKNSRKLYEDNITSFLQKLEKCNKKYEEIYNDIPNVKDVYDLSLEDVDKINALSDNLYQIDVEYKELEKSVNEHSIPYSKAIRLLESVTNSLMTFDDDLDYLFKNFGSLHEDDARAREQIVELDSLLKEASNKLNTYKLPVIDDMYYIELNEAYDAIKSIEKELTKLPIKISTLNMRVDTARDLAIKVFNASNSMVKTAKLTEMVIVYGNRYRSSNTKVDNLLTKAEKLFYSGNYKDSLNCAIDGVKLVESDFDEKISKIEC